MAKMTIFHLGVVVFAICFFSTQVVSQDPTAPTTASTNTNATNATHTTMTMSMVPNSNTTSNSTGVGVSLHHGSSSFLVPSVMATLSLLQRYC